MSEPLFNPGQVVATPGALEALRTAGQTPAEFLARHQVLDPGELNRADWELNRSAVFSGARIFSAYLTKTGEKVWVITEACDDDGIRASTCVLTPDEY